MRFRKVSLLPTTSLCASGQSSTMSVRPASVSEIVGTVRKFDEPVSRN
jgi:hypothetical protein